VLATLSNIMLSRYEDGAFSVKALQFFCDMTLITTPLLLYSLAADYELKYQPLSPQVVWSSATWALSGACAAF
jgi:hypothetical protein